MPLINWRANQPCRTGQIYQPKHKNPSSPPRHGNRKTQGILLVHPKDLLGYPPVLPSLVNGSFPGKIKTQDNIFGGLKDSWGGLGAWNGWVCLVLRGLGGV